MDDIRQKISRDSANLDSAERQRALELASIGNSLNNLMTFPFVSERVSQGTLRLRGAFFDIATGVLHVLDSNTGTFEPAA